MELFCLPFTDIILIPLMHLKDSAQNNAISGPNPEDMPCTEMEEIKVQMGNATAHYVLFTTR